MSSATTPIRLKSAADLGVTKDTVGLGSVENKSSATIRAEIVAADLAGTGKAFTVLPASGATVGATIGVNFDGQFTTANIANFFAAKVLTAGIIDVADLFAQAISVTDTIKVGSDTSRYLLTLDGRGAASPIAIIDKTNGGALVFGFDSDDKPYFGGGLRDGAINNINVFTEDVLTQLKPIVVGSTGGIFKLAGVPIAIGTTTTQTVTVSPANASAMLIGLSFSDTRVITSGPSNMNFTAPKYLVTVKRTVNGGGLTVIHNQTYTGVANNRYDSELGRWDCNFHIYADITLSDINHNAADNDSIVYTFVITRTAGSFFDPKITAASCSQQTQGGGTAGVANQLTAPYVGLTANGSGIYPAMEVKNSPTTYSDWIRTPPTGLLPHTMGGTSFLGTPDWPFGAVYSNALFDNNNRVYSAVNPNIGTGSSNYAAGNHTHTIANIPSLQTSLDAKQGIDTQYGALVASRYLSGGTSTVGTKIRLPFLTDSGKMVCFTVRVYQNYQTTDVLFSGYLYSTTNQWHDPKAVVIAGSQGLETRIGRDTDGRAYVWLTGGWYRGVAVLDVVGGYASANWNTGWEISESDSTPNMAWQSVIYPPYSPSNKPSPADIGAQPAGSYAAASHTHEYLPLAGGLITGTLTAKIGANSGFTLAANSTGYSELVYVTSAGSNEWGTGLRCYSGADWRVGTQPIYHTGNKPTPAEIGAQPAGSYAAASHTHDYAPSVSATLLGSDSTAVYGRQGLQVSNFAGVGGTGANGTQLQNPTNAWYHHITLNHANSNGYYVDIAACFYSNILAFRRVVGGSDTGWNHLYHSGNTNIGTGATNYAAGNHDHSSISGNAATATLASYITVNASSSAAYYNVVWHSGNTLFNSSSPVQIRPSDGTLAAGHFVGNLNLGGTGAASHHPSGIFSQGTNWLYGPIITAGNSIDAGGGTITCGRLAANGGLQQNGQVILNGSDTWLRTNGTTGWYNETYAGGMHMTEAWAVRAYNGSDLYVGSHGRIASSNRTAAGFVYTDTEGGLVGPYSRSGTANAMIWTIGEQWRTLATMYGMLYSYNSSLVSGHHQICFASEGVQKASISLSSGDFRTLGLITASGNVTAADCISTSDIRVKTNIQPIVDPIGKLMKLSGNTFNRLDMDGRHHAGVIAQEVQAVLPQAIFETDDKELGKKLNVSSSAMIGLLVAAVKDQQKQITRLQRQLNNLSRAA